MSNFDHIFTSLDDLGAALLAREKLLIDLGDLLHRIKAKFADLDLTVEKTESESKKLEVADKLSLLESALEIGLTEEGAFKLFYSVYPPYGVSVNNMNTIMDALRSSLPSILGASSPAYHPYSEEDYEEEVIDQEAEVDVSESIP